MRRWWSCVALSVALAGVVGACSDEDRADVSQRAEEALTDARQRAREAADAVEQAGDRAGARAVAEAIRAALVVENLEADQNVRDVDVLREAVGDVPGDPQVSGIDDANGDGRDDDGKIEVAVDAERACLTLPDGGGDIDVAAQAC
jgi:hypothetical protein